MQRAAEAPRERADQGPGREHAPCLPRAGHVEPRPGEGPHHLQVRGGDVGDCRPPGEGGPAEPPGRSPAMAPRAGAGGAAARAAEPEPRPRRGQGDGDLEGAAGGPARAGGGQNAGRDELSRASRLLGRPLCRLQEHEQGRRQPQAPPEHVEGERPLRRQHRPGGAAGGGLQSRRRGGRRAGPGPQGQRRPATAALRGDKVRGARGRGAARRHGRQGRRAERGAEGGRGA
mmetsp:Transcript_17394/g.54670  ORF Transcript_17394/g.54670 Transcript_17394/m.54670 type:complete len:230 (+) Transcript_17394:992-1681(+)